MNFLRNAVSHTRLNYRISRVVGEAVGEQQIASAREECVALAEEFPEQLLTTLSTFLTPSHPAKAVRGLELLEYLVQSCSRAFHVALAKCHPAQQKLLGLAMHRCGSDRQLREAQRLARLTILEYSRIFMADPDLQRLATLAGLFESQTRRSLLRCLNVQMRHVAFTDPRPADVILISPRKPEAAKTLGFSSSGMPYTSLQEFFAARVDKVEPPGMCKQPLPKSLTSPQRWTCQACGLVNSPMALLCSACETPRVFEPDREKEAAETENHHEPPQQEKEGTEVTHVDPAVGSSSSSPAAEKIGPEENRGRMTLFTGADHDDPPPMQLEGKRLVQSDGDASSLSATTVGSGGTGSGSESGGDAHSVEATRERISVGCYLFFFFAFSFVKCVDNTPGGFCDPKTPKKYFGT
eukprot:gene11615-8004_t